MPTSLVSTGVQFPDSTIQTTAATAGGTATFTSSGSITAGQPVALNSNGTVSSVASTAVVDPSIAQILPSGSNTSVTVVYHWPTSTFFCFSITSSFTINYATGVYSGGSVTWTDRGTLNSASTVQSLALDVLSACISPDGNYLVLGHLRSSQLFFQTFSISGTTVTFVGSAAYSSGVGHNNSVASSLNVDFCPKANAYLWVGNMSPSGTNLIASSSFTVSGAGAITLTNSSTPYSVVTAMNYSGAAVVCPGAAVTVCAVPSATQRIAIVRFAFGRNGAQFSPTEGAAFTDRTDTSAGYSGGRCLTGAYDARRGKVFILAPYSCISLDLVTGITQDFPNNTYTTGSMYIGAGAAYNRYTQDIFILSKGANSFDWSYLYTTRGGGGSTSAIWTVQGLSQAYTSNRNNASYAQCGTPDGAMLVPYNLNSSALYSFLYRPLSSNYNRFIGFATSSVGSGASVTVTVAGGTNSQQSGLIAGTPYYVSPSGGLTFQNTDVFAGIATSSTAIILGGSK